MLPECSQIAESPIEVRGDATAQSRLILMARDTAPAIFAWCAAVPGRICQQAEGTVAARRRQFTRGYLSEIPRLAMPLIMMRPRR